MIFENNNVVASGAMFYFGPDVSTKIKAQGLFQMSGMESGACSRDSDLSSRNSAVIPTMLIEGGANLTIDALIYTPRTKLEMGGNSGMTLGAGFIVADTVMFRAGLASAFPVEIVGPQGHTKRIGAVTPAIKFLCGKSERLN